MVTSTRTAPNGRAIALARSLQLAQALQRRRCASECIKFTQLGKAALARQTHIVFMHFHAFRMLYGVLVTSLRSSYRKCQHTSFAGGTHPGGGQPHPQAVTKTIEMMTEIKIFFLPSFF